MAKKTNEVTFEIGSRVIVNNEATGNTDIEGRVIEMKKGWYNVEYTVDGETKKVSARARSLKPVSMAWGFSKTADTTTHPVISESDNSEEAKVVDSAPEEGPEVSAMSKALSSARARYVKTKRPNGHASADVGDITARALRELDPMQTVQLAETICRIAKGSLTRRYGNLNPGQQRMNSGNRIRSLLKNIRATKTNSNDPEELNRAAEELDRIEGMLEVPFDVLAVYAEEPMDVIIADEKFNKALGKFEEETGEEDEE